MSTLRIMDTFEVCNFPPKELMFTVQVTGKEEWLKNPEENFFLTNIMVYFTSIPKCHAFLINTSLMCGLIENLKLQLQVLMHIKVWTLWTQSNVYIVGGGGALNSIKLHVFADPKLSLIPISEEFTVIETAHVCIFTIPFQTHSRLWNSWCTIRSVVSYVPWLGGIGRRPTASAIVLHMFFFRYAFFLRYALNGNGRGQVSVRHFMIMLLWLKTINCSWGIPNTCHTFKKVQWVQGTTSWPSHVELTLKSNIKRWALLY